MCMCGRGDTYDGRAGGAVAKRVVVDPDVLLIPDAGLRVDGYTRLGCGVENGSRSEGHKCRGN
jgi:hypothetical protein